jgi:hypothetical protein
MTSGHLDPRRGPPQRTCPELTPQAPDTRSARRSGTQGLAAATPGGLSAGPGAGRPGRSKESPGLIEILHRDMRHTPVRNQRRSVSLVVRPISDGSCHETDTAKGHLAGVALANLVSNTLTGRISASRVGIRLACGHPLGRQSMAQLLNVLIGLSTALIGYIIGRLWQRVADWLPYRRARRFLAPVMSGGLQVVTSRFRSPGFPDGMVGGGDALALRELEGFFVKIGFRNVRICICRRAQSQ